MNAACLSTISALAGSIVGGLTSGLASWLNQRSHIHVSQATEYRKHDRDGEQEYHGYPAHLAPNTVSGKREFLNGQPETVADFRKVMARTPVSRELCRARKPVICGAF
jgi:hypothetical protein